jgi:N-acylneuraminate cytidylyltransferase/CMP-N,N'-diacetyllegionaminic acid synthase
MYKGKKIMIIIIARGGSKRLPDKNTKRLYGKPLIGHVIKAALGSKHKDRVVVSTDSKEIAKIARKYGAEVPFLRPASLATNTAKAVSVLQHAVSFFSSRNFNPDIVVFTKPTSPLVLPEDIDGTIEEMFKTKTDSCFSACAIGERPEWMYAIKKGRPILFSGDAKALQIRHQDLPKLYRINGAVYVMKKEILMKKNKFIGDNPSIFMMSRERSVDIDEQIDFQLAEALMRDASGRQ